MRSYLVWILGTIDVGRNDTWRDTRAPPPMFHQIGRSRVVSCCCAVYVTPPVEEPATKGNLSSSSKCLPQTSHGARTCCWGIVPRHFSAVVLLVSLCATLRYIHHFWVICALLRRRCSAAVTLWLISRSFTMSHDLSRARI